MKNLWNDDLTKSIAGTVSDVLEGKVKKEEMDPTDHVKQKDGGFVVVDANGKEVKSLGKKDEADAAAIKNHDDLIFVQIYLYRTKRFLVYKKLHYHHKRL